MYNFVFYFFYKYFEKTGDSIPQYRAILAVSTTIGFHVFCIVSIVKYLFEFNIPRIDEKYLLNKLYLMPLALLLILLVYLYYNKIRIDKIIESKVKNIDNVFSYKNIFLIILIIGVPLIIGIMFIKLGQRM